METYTAMRQFADSWALLAMFVFFIGVIIFVMRPGSKKIHDDIANIPLRDDDPDRVKRDDAPDPDTRDDASDRAKRDAKSDRRAARHDDTVEER